MFQWWRHGTQLWVDCCETIRSSGKKFKLETLRFRIWYALLPGSKVVLHNKPVWNMMMATITPVVPGIIVIGYYDNNVKLGNCVLYVFLWLILLFFYNTNNVNLIISCPWSLYGCIGPDHLSRDVVNFFSCLCVYVLLCWTLVNKILSLLLPSYYPTLVFALSCGKLNNQCHFLNTLKSEVLFWSQTHLNCAFWLFYFHFYS